jgi:hypothetical protein
LRATLETNAVYACWALKMEFQKNHFKKHFDALFNLKMLAGHIKVFGGPHVDHGPNIAQAFNNITFYLNGPLPYQITALCCMHVLKN